MKLKKPQQTSQIVQNEELSNQKLYNLEENGKFHYRNSKNYFQLPFNPKLIDLAKKNRRSNNLSETLFWNQIKSKKFHNLDFDRQKIIGNYIVDFYCSNFNIIIEIDGNSHNDKQEYDSIRDQFFEGLGLKIIHIESISVLNDMDRVIEFLNGHPFLKDHF